MTIEQATFSERVQKYIQTWTVDDLAGMSELAFEITVEMSNYFEQRKVTAYNQDLARISFYKEWRGKTRKDWKPFSDMQADRLGKENSLEAFDYTLFEVWYRRLKSLLDRLLEKKIEAAVANKLSRELVANARQFNPIHETWKSIEQN